MTRILGAFLRPSPRVAPLTPFLYRRSSSVAANTILADTTTSAHNDSTNPEEQRASSVRTASSTEPKLEGPVPAGIGLSKNKLHVTHEGRKYSFVNYLLRDACKCPHCVDQYSKQRKFRISDIPLSISPRSVKWDGTELEVQWVNDIKGYDEAHVSKYDLESLRFPLPHGKTSSSGQNRKRMCWNSSNMKKNQHWISYNDYMDDSERFRQAMRHLALFGIIFVKDIPDSREMVEKIATRMGPLRNTFYGSTWDVRSVPEAKNIAYTNQFLGFHMDLMYMNEPPGFQLLHCIENSCEGGESLFADTFLVAERLRKQKPYIYETLTKCHLEYEYNHKDHIYNNSWPVFQVDKLDDTREPALSHVNYSPPFQAPVIQSKGFKSKYAANREALSIFAAELQRPQNVFQLKLNPGECVIFENRRVVHARRQFDTNTGKRWLAGAYVDEDAVRSKFAACDLWKVRLDLHKNRTAETRSETQEPTAETTNKEQPS